MAAQPATSAPPADELRVRAGGTTLYVERRGAGEPLLLIHGAGEDASLLAPQADSLAAAGFAVITYDRRGTGRSGRDDWPGTGAQQHADDAADLLRVLELTPATVVGVSSGGVIALELASRHTRHTAHVVAWEPPAAGVLPDGRDLTAAIMAPVHEHLAARPGDWVGAQALLLTEILGFPVTIDDPAFAATRVNAEPMVRDEPSITIAGAAWSNLGDVEVTIAVGSEPNRLIAAATERLGAMLAREVVHGRGPHEVYLDDPSVLTSIVIWAVRS